MKIKTIARVIACFVTVISVVRTLQCDIKDSEYGFSLLASAFSSFITTDVGICHESCYADVGCMSITFDLMASICHLNNVTKAAFPSRFIERESFIYAELRERLDYGTSPVLAVESCSHIHKLNPSAISGKYWINVKNLSPQSSSAQVYCDMTTDGGGWTLVYNYRFTRFNSFNSYSNAVTPVPTWPTNAKSSVPVSTQTPTNESFPSAMDFGQWKNIGNEFLVKSNINHWIACIPVTGSLVEYTDGSLNCRSIKNVASKCFDYAPTKLQIISYCGPALRNPNGRSTYFFDGALSGCYPTHDPCGTSKITNHLTNVPNPGGSIFIR